MDLIEVLWKQDVDLGFTLAAPIPSSPKNAATKAETPDDVEKLKALLELKTDEVSNVYLVVILIMKLGICFCLPVRG